MAEQNRFYPGQADELVTERERKGCALARRAASEGMVLLENDGTLPLRPGCRVALYGLGARHTIKGGSGSGDVNSRHVVSVAEGMKAAGFEIVNDAYLDALDTAYRQALIDWEQKIYEAAGPGKDPDLLYDAHVRYTVAQPSLPVGEDSYRDAEVLIYILSRTSGEGADRTLGPGDYELTEDEAGQIRTLSESGKPLVILLNVGGIIELSFMDTCQVAALLLMGQAGCEAGNAVADILSGAVSPSGCLTDTWAFHYDDYPCARTFSYLNGNVIEEKYTEGIYVGYRYFDTFGIRPRYMFGYGLSYTTFEEHVTDLCMKDDVIGMGITVKNTGSRPGAHVVQVYAACPAREQKKEFRRLVDFTRTGVLGPGESEKVYIQVPLYSLVSYREGIASYVLEKGRYTLLLGPENKPVFALDLKETQIIQHLSNVCECLDALTELTPSDEQIERRDSWIRDHSENLWADEIPPVAIKRCRNRCNSDNGLSLEGAETARQAAYLVLGTLTEEEKIRLVVGAPGVFSGGMVGDSGTHVPGAAGETVCLPERGIPGMVMADGPAGLRLQMHYEVNPEDGSIYQLNRFEMLENRFFGKLRTHENARQMWQFATAIPAGTLLAQTFDRELMKEIGACIAGEMKAFGIGMWLAPGMNIHRNPLCGRNYEYYSEDPVVSGEMAAALTEGVQQTEGLGVTIKHFACNNQEENRTGVSATVSERTLREIYLKGFEIAVKTGKPEAIMTSYNRINCVHAANSVDLCGTVAREEWQFDGLIMTDWTTTNAGHGASAAKCIRAGNNLIMPGRESDRQEIRAALHGEGNCTLTAQLLDRSVYRVVYAALYADQALTEPGSR